MRGGCIACRSCRKSGGGGWLIGWSAHSGDSCTEMNGSRVSKSTASNQLRRINLAWRMPMHCLAAPSEQNSRHAHPSSPSDHRISAHGGTQRVGVWCCFMRCVGWCVADRPSRSHSPVQRLSLAGWQRRELIRTNNATVCNTLRCGVHSVETTLHLAALPSPALPQWLRGAHVASARFIRSRTSVAGILPPLSAHVRSWRKARRRRLCRRAPCEQKHPTTQRQRTSHIRGCHRRSCCSRSVIPSHPSAHCCHSATASIARAWRLHRVSQCSVGRTRDRTSLSRPACQSSTPAYSEQDIGTAITEQQANGSTRNTSNDWRCDARSIHAGATCAEERTAFPLRQLQRCR